HMTASDEPIPIKLDASEVLAAGPDIQRRNGFRVVGTRFLAVDPSQRKPLQFSPCGETQNQIAALSNCDRGKSPLFQVGFNMMIDINPTLNKIEKSVFRLEAMAALNLIGFTLDKLPRSVNFVVFHVVAVSTVNFGSPT